MKRKTLKQLAKDMEELKQSQRPDIHIDNDEGVVRRKLEILATLSEAQLHLARHLHDAALHVHVGSPLTCNSLTIGCGQMDMDDD